MNQPVRVLNLFTIMNRGGAETMVMNYYRKIDRTKVQFDFMVHRQEHGAYDDEIEALGGRIFRMSPIAPATLGKYLRELRDFFQSHPEYRILHAHMSELGYFAFKEAKKWGVPVRICHAHNAPVFFSETVGEKIKRIPREILARLIRRECTDFFTCSQIAGEWLFGRKFSKKMVFMRNAVDAAAFRYNKNLSERIKSQWGWQDHLVIGHVGRFNPQKNHDFLIDVFEFFYQKHPNAVLVLVGSGFLEPIIKEKVLEKHLDGCVKFLGNRSDMVELYQAFDLFLFPSLYEGLPVSLVEAQAAGIPCVVSDRISNQTHIVDSYYPLSLNASLEEWNKVVERALLDGKQDTYSKIKDLGFDIAENALWLCDFYLKKYQEYE